MNTAENNIKVLDFNRFRQERVIAETQENGVTFTPTLLWYPVWVLMPTPAQPQPPAS